MRAQVYKVTRVGTYVLRLVDATPPRIGDILKAGDSRIKVVDIIGPTTSPFIVAKVLNGNIKNEIELSIEKKKARVVRRSRKGRR